MKALDKHQLVITIQPTNTAEMNYLGKPTDTTTRMHMKLFVIISALFTTCFLCFKVDAQVNSSSFQNLLSYGQENHLLAKKTNDKNVENSLSAKEPFKILDEQVLSNSGTNIEWTNIQSAEILADNSLLKTTPNDGWSSGASSVNKLEAGEDGWFEVSVGEIGDYFMIGFSNSDPDIGFRSIEYALYVRDGVLRIYEDGVNRGDFATLSSTDIIKLERAGENINYYYNENIIKTVVVNSEEELIVDASIYRGTIPPVHLYFTPEVPTTYDIQWQNVQIAEITPDNSLRKTNTYDAWSAGASSINALRAGENGWFEVSVGRIGDYFMIGFSKSDTDVGFRSIEYALYVRDGVLRIYEDGVNLGDFATLSSTDVIKLERAGDNINYYYNNDIIKSVVVNSQEQLIVDASLYRGTIPPVALSFSIITGEDDAVEYAALKELFESTTGFDWNDKSNWPYENWPTAIESSGFGTWAGVSVTNGDISSLNFAGNNLHGIIPISVLNLEALSSIDLSNNALIGISGEVSVERDAAFTANFNGNYLDFAAFDQLSAAGIPLSSFNNQKVFPGIGKVKLNEGDVMEIRSVSPGANGVIKWLKKENETSWKDVTDKNQSTEANLFKIDAISQEDEGTYKWEITNSDYPGVLLTSEESQFFILDNENQSEISAPIPSYLQVNSDGKYKAPLVERQFYLNEINAGEVRPLFEAPPCLEGEYYVAFQLEYDLGNLSTQQEWSAFVEINLKKDGNVVWTDIVRVEMLEQTMVSTIFFEDLVSCFEDYEFEIVQKNLTGLVPEENIHLKILLHKILNEPFNPAAALNLSCTYEDEIFLGWSFEGEALLEYDLEWVSIANWEGFSGSSASAAFSFKEPVRITTTENFYSEQFYYPDHTIYFRIRPVGYNPEFPSHRIPGNWHYFDCEFSISNHEPELNWQQQTTFAEEGKFKRIMTYYDESLRQRQMQTNLSTEDVTLVAENLYDFEGRMAASILPAPATDNNLYFKNNYHQFESLNTEVAANTSTDRIKYHYDNGSVENSILSNAVGASNYYSPLNNTTGTMRNYIPDAQGYLLSQTSFTNDGTGRVARQSGVGATFAMDGNHVTRYYYGETTQEELVRLFGSNVGDANHYKKNLTVDPNGQVSVNYMSQNGNTIATALAGTPPDNLTALESYEALTPTPVNVNITLKNTKEDNAINLNHKILNVAPNTRYTFNYSLEATAEQLEIFGCVDCSFDLEIIITNPDGKKMALPEIAGNQWSLGTEVLAYQRFGLTADNCAASTALDNISFQLPLPEIGDYTITKKLKVKELSFTELEEIILQDPSIQQQINEVWETYATSADECVYCLEGCEEAEAYIEEAITEVADINCENIYNNILNDLKDQGIEEPSTAQIEAHPDYCKYELCMQDKASDIFEMNMARTTGWTDAVNKGMNNAINLDPFFNNADLNGASYKTQMLNRLNNLPVATISFDTDGDKEADDTKTYAGPIEEITDPTNTDYYINESGQQNVNGKHILYMDLMGRRAAMGEEAYQAELNQTRWDLYRGFYLEAKRLTKLKDVTAYNTCATAKADLEVVSNLPQKEEDIVEWGEDQLGNGPVSTAELEMMLANMAFECEANFEPEDRTAITGYLESYINSNPSNIFRLILLEDLGVNEDLIAIENILQNYNCTLNKVAVENPLVCLEDTTIVVPVNKQTGFAPNPTSEATLRSASFSDDSGSSFGALTQGDLKYGKRQMLSEYENKRLEFLKKEEEAYDREVASLYKVSEEKYLRNAKEFRDPHDQNLRDSKSLSPSVTNSAGSLTVSQKEYDALVDFFNSTNGLEWFDNTGWVDENDQIRPIETVDEWLGITVSEGHVTEFFLYYNNINGPILPSFNELVYLKSFKLLHFRDINTDNTSGITSLPDPFGAQWLSLETVQLRGNTFTLPESFFSNSLLLESVEVSNNKNIVSLPTTFGDNWINVENVRLERCNLVSLPVNFGKNWSFITNLRLFDNAIESFPEVFYNGFESLTLLFISGNKVSDYDSAFGASMVNIRNLSIGGPGPYSIQDYRVSDFSLPENFGISWSNLENLSIISAGLKELPNDFGRYWSKLEILDMRYLELRELPDNFGISWSNLLVFLSYNYEYQNLLLNQNFGDSWNKLIQLSIGNIQNETLPSNFGNSWPAIRDIQIISDRLKEFPTNFGSNFPNIEEFHFIGKSLERLSDKFGKMGNVRKLSIRGEKLDQLPLNFGSELENLDWLDINTNSFTFAELVTLKHNLFKIPSLFQYQVQSKIDKAKQIRVNSNNMILLTSDIDRSTIPPSKYQWFKKVNGSTTTLQANPTESGHTLEYLVLEEDYNAEFYYQITNPELPRLTLQSYPITVGVDEEIEYREITYCTKYDLTNPTLAAFSFDIDWDLQIEQCLATAASKDSLLVQNVIDKIVEEEVANYYNTASSACIDKVNEKLDYSYESTEYHYTLYYYDQAGNLTQTVPPQGVKPLTDAQVNAFRSGTVVQPVHGFLTNYQYNSLNQIVWQQTPDAGESYFWYNDLSQLRLSQNAKQAAEDKYSYSRYDALGRIVEVGELASAEPATSFEGAVNRLSFPAPADYPLTDITATFYDFADQNAPEGLRQQHLRNRVAFTQVQNADSEEKVKTWYSYDPHGNVNTLMQEIPQMEPKRIDYRYDLVSGNVNEVFYQEGKEDAFIHRYAYDADNRIREVFTSTDAYIWNKESDYQYYQHGPLARTELGNYRIQGMDYFYTLQGWLKGVNMPYVNDPGTDGSTVTGADAFAFTLGYFPNDYTAIGTGIALPETLSTNLWAGAEQTDNALYNGNIAWMVTDLPSLGLANEARETSMQAMQYNYDQLNRIKKANSLTQFQEASGFASRGTEANAYDARYSYDANGNLMTLTRNDEAANVAHDFNYQYYAGTNKLHSLTEGAEAAYVYDEIGNLVNDVAEGTEISWTPYGKVRAVTKADASMTISYLYDAAGNRVEKKTEKEGEVNITRYLRDASGNVMALYKVQNTGEEEKISTEHHLYGSSRLGVVTGKAEMGHLKLGLRTYELSNHLGNVLAVITDNVNMTADTQESEWYDSKAWPTVQSTSDYYPFGLQMAGRTVSNADYRYGFNGKEIDNWGTSSDGGEGANTLEEGLIADYTFEGNANDESANGLNGTVNGATLTVDRNGKANSAYGFDGIDDYIELMGSETGLAYIHNTGVFSISTWVRIDDLSKVQHLLTSISVASDKGITLAYVASKNTLSFGLIVGGSNVGVIAADNSIIDTNWHHITVTGDGQNLRMFIDGVEKGNIAIKQLATGNGSYTLKIGYLDANNVPSNFFDGAVDNLQFYNKTLTATEIASLANSQTGEDIYASNSSIVYDYGFRIYNPTIGKFLSVDPLAASFAWNSPYSYAENDVIRAIDLDGLEKVIYTSEYLKYKMAINMVIMQDTELLSIWSIARKPERASQFDVYFGTHSSKSNQAQGFQADLGSSVKFMNKFESFTANDKIRLGDKYDELLNTYNESKALFTDMGVSREDVMTSIKNGKTVLAVSLNREYLKLIYSEGGSINYEALSQRTYELMHEIDLHLRNELNGISKNQVEEHKEWYNILESSKFYKYFKIYIEEGFSPRKEQIDKNSRGAEVYEAVDRATQTMKSKYE